MNNFEGHRNFSCCATSISDGEAFSFTSISGNFGFETCTHGDFLGSILGTGIVRDKVGDILLQV